MIQVPLDNLAKTRQYLAEKVLNLVQAYYTEERIIQVVDESDPMKASEEIILNQQNSAGQISNNLTLGEYDVIISTSPARDNFDEMQFAEALQLREVGVPIPDDVVVDFSHLSRKGEIAQRIREMQGTAPPTEEEKAVMEFQQEVALQNLELELEKLRAEVSNIEAEAQLNISKAEENKMDPQLKMAEIQSKIQMKQDELAVRRELAGLTNEQRRLQSETQAATKLAAIALKPGGE